MKCFRNNLVSILICISVSIAAQKDESDPGWQWGRLSITINAYGTEDIMTDFDNNMISIFTYKDSVIIEDTAFYHLENLDNSIAIVKRNSRGEFIKAVDIYSTREAFLFSAEMCIDKESNIYLYGPFNDTLFVNDHIILPIKSSMDVYLLKLDKNLDFQWAETISSELQDDCRGIAISEDNYIYISAYHLSGTMDTVHYMVNYLSQDSADYFTGLNSLLKVDLDGRLIWRSEIRDPAAGSTSISNTVTGEDGYVYVVGSSTKDFYIQGDTVQFLAFPDFYSIGFIVQFDHEGLHHNAFFNPYKYVGIMSPWLRIDENGNYLISSHIGESTMFGSDTIYIPPDSTFTMIAKLDSNFQPVWHQGIMASNAAYTTFLLNLVKDSIAFAFHGKSRFTFMDTEYTLNAVGQGLFGLFSPDGELVNLQVTDASIGAAPNCFQVDNCGNLLVDGYLRGFAHFGDETVNAGNDFQHFIAKNNRRNQLPLVMPADTAGCDSVILFAPVGYEYYRWNGELSDQNWFIVDSPGTVRLEVAKEDCCWSEAETEVTIWPPITFSLGNDTTILLTDTLELSSLPGYESYLWSTGDTTSNLIIPANLLQIGINKIWLDISSDYCSGSDTINIVVIDNSAINEIEESGISLNPNPAHTFLQITTNSGIMPRSVNIYYQTGIKVLQIKPFNNRVDVSGLNPGFYIVELVCINETIRLKLVIN